MTKYSPSLDSLILDKYGYLAVGETVNGEVCPACNGGRTGEGSFAVTRTSASTLAFICHRNSCGRAGRISQVLVGSPPTGTGEVQGQPVHARLGRKVSKAPQLSEYLSDESSSALYELYGIDKVVAAKAGILDVVPSPRYADKRVAVPVRNIKGEVLGYVLRRLGQADENRLNTQLSVDNFRQHGGLGYSPKAVTIRTSDADEPLLAAYYNVLSKKILVVEDVFSAIRASRLFTTFALLGTNLSDEAARTIKEVANGRPVYLCLDKDAFAKSVDLTYKLRSRGLDITPVFLPKDIKNMTEEELDNFIKENIDCDL